MRHLLALLVAVGLSACAAAPDETPLRFREGAPVLLDVDDELAPAAAVDTGLFVQVELRPLETTDAALAAIGVVFPGGGETPLEAVALEPAQVRTIIEELQEEGRRHPYAPVITLRDQQPLSVGAPNEPAIILQPRVLEDRRTICADVRGSDASCQVTASPGAVLLLRYGRPGGRRWTLVVMTAISLRDEDARRHDIDED